jgi:arsenate reductase
VTKTITIYHNPKCGTSRNVLSAIGQAGFKPDVIEYLKTGWSRDHLVTLFTMANITPRAAMRLRGTKAERQGLTKASATDEMILEAMIEDPNLVNRPFVVVGDRAALCRPLEKIHDLITK